LKIFFIDHNLYIIFLSAEKNIYRTKKSIESMLSWQKEASSL